MACADPVPVCRRADGPTHSWKTARAAASVANHTLNSACPLKIQTNGCSNVGSCTFEYHAQCERDETADAREDQHPPKSIRRCLAACGPACGRLGRRATAGATTVTGSATGSATLAVGGGGGAKGGGGTLPPRGGGFGGVGRGPCCSSPPTSPPLASALAGRRYLACSASTREVGMRNDPRVP